MNVENGYAEGDRWVFPCGCSWPIVGPPPREGAIPLLEVDDENLPFCRAVWDLLASGRTKGVFQLESSLGRQWTKRLVPTNAEHLGALGALLRPGCLKAKDEEGVSMTERFCRRKNGLEAVESYHPVIDRILESTYGTLAFQEQSMEIAKEVAGFSLQEADTLRKSIGKKNTEEMARCRELFLEGAARVGVLSPEQAEEVFGWIEKSQRYSFNRCSAGSERIRRPNGGRFTQGNAFFTIEEMYRIRHDLEYAKATGHTVLRRKWKRLGNYGKGLSLCEDGRIRPNTIVDIRRAGFRTVYRVILANGATIRVTDNHRFPTDLGEMTVARMIEGLAEGVAINLYVCDSYEPTDFGPISRFSSVTAAERKELAKGKKINGCKGESNYGYTNGSYTEFKKNSELIEFRCDACGRDRTETKRLELHHKDRNRGDSTMKNLVRLCSSCHKKEEYRLGRRRKGEKGYPSLLVPVVSIEADGEEETFDVEMEAPNHTYVVSSDIVTCNSHAQGYGITGYESAYVKAHFPTAFYCSWLRFACDAPEPLREIRELVDDARVMDVPVLPPDLRRPEKHFSTDGVEVRFGLADVKGIGDSQAALIAATVRDVSRELGKSPDVWDWTDFLFFCSHRLGSVAVDRLAATGALDWMISTREQREKGRKGPGGRTRMAREIECWRSLTDKERDWILERERVARGLLEAEALAPPAGRGARKKPLPDSTECDDPKAKARLERLRKKDLEKGARQRELFLDALNEREPFRDLVEALDAVAALPSKGGGAANSKRVEALRSLVSLLENPPENRRPSSAGCDPEAEPDRPDTIAWNEEKWLGIALTRHRVEAYDLSDVNISCGEFRKGRGPKNSQLVFGVIVDEVRKVRTRNKGEEMAFLTISDETGSLSDVVCFPEAWKESRSVLVEGDCVVIEAERDKDKGGLIVRRASPLEGLDLAGVRSGG